MQLLQINSRNIRSLLLFLYFVLFHSLNFNCGHYRNAETEKKGIPYLLLENAEFVLGEHSTNMLTLHSLFSYVHKPNLCWCSLSNFYSKSDHDLLFFDVCVCVCVVENLTAFFDLFVDLIVVNLKIEFP